MTKKIVIVGAGYAGIEAALKLHKNGRNDDIDITIIDRNPYHTLLTEIHEVAGNRMAEDAIKVPLSDIFKHTRVKSVVDDINRFDFENKIVASSVHEYPYDYLIMALGSTPNYFGIPGLEEHGFPLWSASDAVIIRDHIKRCFHEAETEPDTKRRERLLTFVVGGAGFTGVEMIGELGQWVKKLCRQHRIKRDDVSLVLVDMLDCVLSNLCDLNSKRSHDYMTDKLGIEVILSTAIKQVTPDFIDLGNRTIGTCTLIWAAGVRAALDVDNMDIVKSGAQRLCVDEYCRTKYDNVFAVGDVGALLDSEGKPYPAMVETALQTAEGVAHNILTQMRGREPEPIKVKLHGVMVSIGNYFAVSDLMGMRPGRWISLFMKYLVNMHYIHGILGIKGVWHYLHDEILKRKQHKRFLQRNYTKTVQAWWLVPLRLFLGWTWFYEGLKKIQEGWMTTPKLAAFLGYTGADGTSAATGAADAASAATAGAQAVAGATPWALEGGAAVVEKLINIDLGFLGIFLERYGEGTPLVFRIKFFLVDWIVNGWVLATEGWAMFFQIFIVIVEILVGLAIFSGTFTFLASVVSLGLIAMFVTSTGMYDTTWWMLFAGIAIAAGAGRAFGFDHWVLPYLGRVWDATKKNGRLTLIFGRDRMPKIK